MIDYRGFKVYSIVPTFRSNIRLAAAKGFYHSPGWNKDYPRLQIVTVEDLLSGKQIEMPPSQMTFKQAERVTATENDQESLFSSE
ncbi:MAG TPA: hypothetical protein PKE66_17955 [Pyrinomonadaceae bacterium]|nr:hypothetical protein [Pyrinomonadaceae bacterium]